MTANIIAVVAVLLMNIENTAETNIKPKSTVCDLFPKGLKSTLAKFLSKPHLPAPIARKKPPMNSMMIGSANVAISDLYFMSLPNARAPSTSSPRRNENELSETVRSMSTIVRTEVVQIGTASVIHISAANIKSAITRCSTTLRLAMW